MTEKINSVYQEFRYPDEDPKWAAEGWEDVYSVLAFVDSEAHTQYIINPHEGTQSLTIQASEVKNYRDILDWIEAHAENMPKDEPSTQPDSLAEQAKTDDADS